MLIYHYATQPFTTLTTKRHRNILTEEELQEGLEISSFRHTLAPYYDHISFFVDPLPLDRLGAIFSPYEHHIWVPGGTVYEHVVDVKSIGNLLYEFVETPLDVFLYNNKWSSDASDSVKEKYFIELAKGKDKNGDRGVDVNSFMKAARKYIGGTADAFEKASKINTPEEMKLYAANVPHVQLYPEKGFAPLITAPTKKKIKAKSRPGSAEW